MKKLLVASTALLMTAGAAAADVTVGGNGRMGLHFDGEDWNFTSRVRVTFTLSGQTDNGLSFGGSIRADNAANGAAGAAGNIWVSGAFGKVMMGDVDGAAEVVAGNVSGVGLTGLGDLNDTVYFSDFVGDPVQDPTFQYTYTMSGFTFAASATDGNGAIGGRGIGGHLARQFTWPASSRPMPSASATPAPSRAAASRSASATSTWKTSCSTMTSVTSLAAAA